MDNNHMNDFIEHNFFVYLPGFFSWSFISQRYFRRCTFAWCSCIMNSCAEIYLASAVSTIYPMWCRGWVLMKILYLKKLWCCTNVMNRTFDRTTNLGYLYVVQVVKAVVPLCSSKAWLVLYFNLISLKYLK